LFFGDIIEYIRDFSKGKGNTENDWETKYNQLDKKFNKLVHVIKELRPSKQILLKMFNDGDDTKKVNGNGKDMNGKDVSPNRKDVSPNGKDMNGKDMSPNGKDVSPNGKDISPNGKKSPTFPKRPLTAYNFFSMSRRNFHSNKTKTINQVELKKLIQQEWKALSDEEKKSIRRRRA